jgi:hypothetical protein
LQYSGSSADCVAIGMDVMRNQLYGGNNIGIGARAFQDGNLCYNSIAIGTRALGESIDGVGNVAIGTRAGENSTRTKHCVLIGDQAGADGNLTGTQNVGVGALSLLNLTTGANNTSVGAQSGKTITTQSYCAFFGYGSGSANTGPQSTALGAFAMENASGDTNTGAGYSAGRGVTTGAGNICIGAWTGVSVGSGSYNVILHGDWRSSDLTTGHRNIIIGYEADNPSGLASDWMNIGNTLYGAVCSASTKGILVTATAPSSSTLSTKAILQVDSTSQGALLPRMTTTQRDAITSPPEGLEIYNLTTHKKQIFTGSVWETITSA